MKLKSILLAFCLMIMCQFASATVINVKSAPYNATGNGTTDDRPAFSAAISAMGSGDILLVPPGTYRIVTLTTATLTLPAGTTILGQDSASIINLDGTGTGYREFMRPGGSNCTIEGLTVVRTANFPIVMFPIMGSSNPADYKMRKCTIIGNRDMYSSYCHAIQVGNNTVTNVLLEGNTYKTCSYGLLQSSASTGTINGFTVQDCHFIRNYDTDLEFNAPNATVNNVNVSDCWFRDNQAPTTNSGWAVGFAHITTGSVRNCFISNYRQSALHVEDRSTGIDLSGNTIVGGGMVQTFVIVILNASNGVTIDHNVVDGRPNTNAANLILVTAGGANYPVPTNVSVTNNILVNSSSTSTWYLQPGSGPAPTGNKII